MPDDPQPNGAQRLADLEEQIRRAEGRRLEISQSLAALDQLAVSEKEVDRVLGGFQSFFERLPKADAAHTLANLVEQVVYDRDKGTVALSFHPTGIKSLTEEINS